ncbi:MAG: hypothetical protein V1792_09755 [Pseudomonadota bacterium]
MSTTVFVLGAGASKQAGAPLMNDFLDKARDLLARGEVDSYAPSFRNVFRAIGRLQRVHSKANLDIHNLEEVFAAFEMARILKKLADFELKLVDNLSKDMRILITRTIENSLLFPAQIGERDNYVYYRTPPPYGEFVHLLQHLRGNAVPNHDVTVVTFNYDLAVDFALCYERIEHNYCLDDSDDSGQVDLLKLHGSLNWIYCKKCGRIHKYDLSGISNGPQRVVRNPGNGTLFPLEIDSELVELYCGQETSIPDPMIVPPTWDKSDGHKTLACVWRKSAEKLGNAENIFIIGYSLPQSDAFFRYLFALGSEGDRPLRNVVVYNPAEDPRQRFETLLGPGAKNRFVYKTMKFDEAIEDIKMMFPG